MLHFTNVAFHKSSFAQFWHACCKLCRDVMFQICVELQVTLCPESGSHRCQFSFAWRIMRAKAPFCYPHSCHSSIWAGAAALHLLIPCHIRSRSSSFRQSLIPVLPPSFTSCVSSMSTIYSTPDLMFCRNILILLQICVSQFHLISISPFLNSPRTPLFWSPTRYRSPDLPLALVYFATNPHSNPNAVMLQMVFEWRYVVIRVQIRSRSKSCLFQMSPTFAI